MTPPSDNGLATGLKDLEKRMLAPLLEQCQADYDSWNGRKPTGNATPDLSNLIAFLKIRIGEAMQRLDDLRRAHLQFTRALSASPDASDQQHLILAFARELGATPADLKKDEAAFSRWFGADAVTDRYHRRHAYQEQYATFLLGRLAAVASHMARTLRTPEASRSFWNELQLETVVKPLLVHDGDVRLNHAAFRCLAEVLSSLSPDSQAGAVDDRTLQYIFRSALEHSQEVWIQCAALELLVTLSWTSFERALAQRLLQPAAGDDLFVRRRAVQLLAAHCRRLSCSHELVTAVLQDPSPFVRQALPAVVVQALPGRAISWMRTLLFEDASPTVRAAAWLQWPGTLVEPGLREAALQCFKDLRRLETDEFVLRTAFHASEKATEALVLHKDPFLAAWRSVARQTLLHLRCHADSTKVRRWASQSFEYIWSECHPRARVLRGHFAAFARSIRRGQSCQVPRTLIHDLDPVFMGRVWAVVCRQDYDVQLQATRRGFKITRGHPFGFRWWRWWHEFRHPSPDKRQAFPHTVGRVFDGELLVPSGILSELAQTKVPGEPLHLAEEGGWRPYLPLPDVMTSSIEFGRRPGILRLFTTEGITTVTPPRRWARWQAAAQLTWRFQAYADKRNWLKTLQEPATTYVDAFRKLGFQIEFATYDDDAGGVLPPDPMVQRFFVKQRGTTPDPDVPPEHPAPQEDADDSIPALETASAQPIP